MRALSYARLLRAHQWVKNLFVLGPLLFAHAWDDAALAAAALGAAIAFCFASSAAYAFNDCRDAAADRDHPDKRDRPVASGALAPGEACAFAAALAAGGLALAAWVDAGVLACVAAYLALNLAYSLALRRVAFVDVLAIAAGFLLRLLAGGAAIGLAPSPWLVACGLLLSAFLGFAKRRAERSRLAAAAARHRPVLAAYSTRFLDAALVASAAGLLCTYSLYAIAADAAALHGTLRLAWSLPWVTLGISRYLVVVYRHGGGGDPAAELLRDPVLELAALGWGAAIASAQS